MQAPASTATDGAIRPESSTAPPEPPLHPDPQRNKVYGISLDLSIRSIDIWTTARHLSTNSRKCA